VIAAMASAEVGLRLLPTVPMTCAHRLGPLAGQQADAARRGMNQHPMVRLDLECLVQEIPDRQPFSIRTAPCS